MRSIMLESCVASFKNIFSLKGRACRTDYWSFSLVYGGASGVIFLWLSSMDSVISTSLILIIACADIIFYFSLLVKRLHDFNKSGYYIIFCLVPLLNLIFFIYIAFSRGNMHPNKYGNPPSSFGKVTALDEVLISLNIVLFVVSLWLEINHT